MVKRTFRITGGIRGSAIIMALMAAVVLITLALAIVSLSLSNLDVNQADAMNNDAYYAAEAGVNNAIEQLKQEVADYYNDMVGADSGDFDYLYDRFFSEINSRADRHFIPPSLNDGLTPETEFSWAVSTEDENVGEFFISSTATAPDKSKYRVVAKLYVKRLDISQPSWIEIDDQEAAYKIGGTLTLNSGYGVYNGGNVIASALNNPKNQYYYVQPPGEFQIRPGTANTINDCLEYPSYNNPSLTPTYVVTTNNTELNGNTVNPATGKKLFEEKNAVIVSNPGISFKIGWGNLVKGTVIYQRGSGTLTLSCSNTNNTITCYSDGNVVTNSGPVYADIYCRGNVSTSGDFHGNIVCDGNCTEACNTFVGSLICGGSINCNGGLQGSFFAVGQITINNGNQGNNVVYSKTKIVLGSGNYQNVVLFSGGDIDITGGSSLTGSICAKGNVNQNSWLTLNYSKSAIQDIITSKDNSFFFENLGGGGGEIVGDSNIIVGQEITAIGRVN